MGKENNISKMISKLVTQKVRLDGAKSELEDDLQVQRYLGTCTEIDKTSDKLKETLEKASTNEIVGILYLLMSKRNELIGELEDRIREENGEALECEHLFSSQDDNCLRCGISKKLVKTMDISEVIGLDNKNRILEFRLNYQSFGFSFRNVKIMINEILSENFKISNDDLILLLAKKMHSKVYSKTNKRKKLKK